MKNLSSFVFAACLALAACQGVIETYNNVLLQPQHRGGSEIVIIALNGALCDPHTYIPFFQEVQSASANFSVWVALPKFYFDIPFATSSAISAAIEDLKAENVSTDVVFIAGHSLGGVTGQEYANSNSASVKGLILLGSYIQIKFEEPQVKFPVPVLTLSGELDGLSKISRVAISFNQMLRHPEQKGHLRFPVAIVPGATHSSYLDGSEEPSTVQKSDLKPEISNEEAWKTFGKLIAAFIDVQVNSQSARSSEKLLLDYIYGVSYPLVKPLLQTFTLEGHPHLFNTSIAGYTKWAVDNVYTAMDLAPERLKTNISIQDDEFFSFMLSKPSASFQNEVLIHQLYARKSYNWLEHFDISQLAYESAESIAIKYKSSAAIYRAANLSGTPKQITCKDLNQKAIEAVLSVLPQSTLARYQRYGVKYALSNDTACSTGFTWISSGLSFEDKGDQVHISSPLLLTDVDSFVFAGMFYCKLLSPARIAEWVYTDSLRKNYSLRSPSNENIKEFIDFM